MKTNTLLDLERLGQSIWLDFLRRGAIDDGQLRRWIEQDGVGGLTSNPSIFEKAIGESHDYDEAVHKLAQEGKDIDEIYQVLTVEDIQRAADLFRPTYDRLEGKDGYVSLEVSPRLSRDTEGTIAEARKLWAAADRPNLFIKVPATEAGIPAIQELIGEGINVNITLLFGLPRYRQVVEAYQSGMEILIKQGIRPAKTASVASFFLSRIDVLVDPMLDKISMGGGEKADIAGSLKGEAATASAKVAYQIYKKMFASERWKKLADKGARTQRLLWASTSTKNPAYSDVKYVEPLIGKDTINTLPIETLDAYRDHGKPHVSMEEDLQNAYETLENLERVGIDLNACTQQLEEEGEAKFNKALDQLMAALKEKREAALKEPLKR
jgi:transaldolase